MSAGDIIVLSLLGGAGLFGIIGLIYMIAKYKMGGY